MRRAITRARAPKAPSDTPELPGVSPAASQLQPPVEPGVPLVPVPVVMSPPNIVVTAEPPEPPAPNVAPPMPVLVVVPAPPAPPAPVVLEVVVAVPPPAPPPLNVVEPLVLLLVLPVLVLVLLELVVAPAVTHRLVVSSQVCPAAQPPQLNMPLQPSGTGPQ